MSFSGDVKKELCRADDERKDCCMLAECYGALIMGKSFSPREIRFSSEYDFAAEYIASLISKCLGREVCSVVKNNSKYQLVIKDSKTIKDAGFTIKKIMIET